MTTRRLQQTHPPRTESDSIQPESETLDANGGTDIDITESSPGRWEGRVRLEDGRTVP